MAIDAMIPIGRGQRELIIGDRSTGKTTIASTRSLPGETEQGRRSSGDKDYRPLYCIYVAIGQKQSSIARIMTVLEDEGAMEYTIIVAASASDSRRTNTSRRLPARDRRVVHGQWHGRADRLR